MKNTRLLQLLSTLSKYELKQYVKYVNQRYTGNEVPLKILAFVVKYYPTFESRTLTKNYVLTKVLDLPNAPDKRVSNEIHKLSEWLIDFLILEKTKVGSLCRERLQLDIFKERQLGSFFFQKASAYQKLLAKQKQSVWQYLETLQVWHSLYYYSATAKLKDADSLLRATVEALEDFHHLSLLKYGSELQNRAKILKSTNGSNWRDKLLQQLASVEKPNSEQPIFELYYKLFQFTTKRSASLYQELKEMLYQESDLIAQEDNIVLLTYLVNYTIKKINSGDSRFVEEAFLLQKFGLEQSILVENGYLSVDKFRNLLLIACELGKTEWAESFLVQYIYNVPNEHRSSLEALGKAYLLFAKEEYSECLDFLNEIEFKDYGYTIQTKFIMLKCYYELREEYERSLNALINSFDNTLLRNKAVHTETLQSYHNAIRIIRLLLRSKNMKTQAEIQMEFEAHKFIAGKFWLQKQIRSYDLE